MSNSPLVINNESNLNKTVINNYSNVKYTHLIPSFAVILLCFLLVVFSSSEDSYIHAYINIQKEVFHYLNAKLSTFPSLQYNLTQLGDVIILFPFVAVFVLYAPKLWEAIVTSSILSLFVSALLKKLFNVPRPAAVFDHDSFSIVGETLSGKTSLPSGHSMTTFIVITLLLFAFMPKKMVRKMVWCTLVLSVGLIIAFCRVGIGAHYPMDVVIGSSIGYILAILGIKLNAKLNWASKLNIKQKGPLLIIVLFIWMGLIVKIINAKSLFIAYLSLVPIILTLYLTSKRYVQKKN